MTTRPAARALPLLAVVLLIAACGGSTATNTPAATQAAVATQTPVATQAPAATPGDNPSIVLPSFHGNVNLEQLLPTQIGGVAINTQSMTGQQFMGSGFNSPLTGALKALGKQASDLSVAFGSNASVQIIAFQVNGVPGDQILAAFIANDTSGSKLTDVSFGGKSVKKVQPADTTQDPSYVYTKNDVVFVVGGAAITDALLNEVFSKLP